MKNLFLASALALTTFGAFASVNAQANANANAKATAPVKSSLVSKAEARKACHEAGKKGKEYQSCVKHKMEGAQS